MDVLEVLPFLVLLAGVALWVSAPMRASRGAALTSPEVVALEAERDARLDAVRDAELDLQTGKLSEEEHRVLDASLRAEAVAALDALDAVRLDEDRS